MTAPVVLLLAFGVARETSLFALRSVEVRGAPPEVARAVRAAAESFVGESLVALDGGELTRRLRSLPSVVEVEYDRAFPHTIRLLVTPERPAAVIRAGTQSWVVSRRGRVIEAVDRLALPDLPRVWLPSSTLLRPGETLPDAHQGVAVRALALLPESFPAAVVAVRESEGELTFVLAGRRELRLGDATEIPLKLDSAASVLESLPATGEAALLYLDVSLPERPVAGTKP